MHAHGQHAAVGVAQHDHVGTRLRRSLADPQMRRLVETLRAEDATFAEFWDEQAVLAREGGLRRFDHAQDGPAAFEQFTFNPADRPDCKLVLLAPRRADVR